MDVKSATKAIRNGETAPVYVLYGTEKYQIQQFTDMLKQQVIEEEHREFAIIPYDLSETPVEVVIEEAETVPFLVPRKLIIVRDANLFTAGKDSKIDHQIDRLLTYMDNPADYSTIVFLAQGDKLDERKKLVKAAKKQAVVLAFAPLSSEELLSWIVKLAKQRDVSFEAGAADTLVSYAGTGLQTLSAEVDKLCLFAGNGGTIKRADIESLVARSTEQNVFALVEELANLRLEKALSLFMNC